MLEQKLVVGRFLKLPDVGTMNMKQGALKDGDFRVVSPRDYTIEESTGSSTKSSNVVQGVGAKQQRNFRWLPYWEGAVTAVPMQGVDILTGKMSGCWLVVFRWNGNRMACHVGTVDSDTYPQTIAVKAAWKAFANRNDVHIIAGFSPLGSLNAIPPAQGLDGRDYLFGLITETNQLYSVFLWRQLDSKNKNQVTDYYRIGALQVVQSATPQTIKALF